MQNELITERAGRTDELNPQEQLNPYRIEDNIVQIVFGGILWNKVIFLISLLVSLEIKITAPFSGKYR
jgi:hypothetical protein